MAAQIIIVDDDPLVGGLTLELLTDAGYAARLIQDSLKAQEIIKAEKPALVILDILMPGLDGVDVCKTMRSDVELADIPVVFVSSLALERLHAVADEAGATDYLPKPVALNDLLNVVGEYLQQAEPTAP